MQAEAASQLVMFVVDATTLLEVRCWMWCPYGMHGHPNPIQCVVKRLAEMDVL
jgi:hypothetical protein